MAATANTVTVSDSFYLDSPDLVVYDTGALAAGRYEIHWTATGGAAASRSSLVRRNAANTADVLPRARLYTPANVSRHVVLRVTLNANERFKVMGKIMGGLTVERLWD